MIKAGDQWGAALHNPRPLCWFIISTCSLLKWSKNKLIALSKQKHGWDINLRQRSSRPSLQLSSGTYWVRGHGGKEKAQHTVTVGNRNSCCATAAQDGKFPDCMSNLSAILATACSAVHARESMFVLLQKVQLNKDVREKGRQFMLKKPRPVCFMYVCPSEGSVFRQQPYPAAELSKRGLCVY